MFKLMSAFVAATVVGVGSVSEARACGCHCSCSSMAMDMPATQSTTDIHSGMTHEEMATPPATARVPGRQTYRSYSYEPGVAPMPRSTRVYSAPRMAPRGRGSRTPNYLLPKTDPRKYSAR